MTSGSGVTINSISSGNGIGHLVNGYVTIRLE